MVGLIIVGVYSYNNYNNSSNNIETIEIANGKMYPEYSKDVANYLVYTDEDPVTINCKNFSNAYGCNETINVEDGVTKYEITTNNDGEVEKYVIEIVKQDTDKSQIIRISSIDGVPKETIKANVEKIEGIKYSFDDGKTWTEDNSKEINKNTTLDILVKDYFFEFR